MGDGRLCFVWLDPWVPGGSIIEQYGKRVIYNAESRQDARLPKFLMNDGEWRWPIVSWELLELREMIQGVGPCMSIGGSLGLGSRQLGIFLGISFVPDLLLIKDRWGMRDRLNRHDSSVPSNCILCGRRLESHDRLFFTYPYGVTLGVKFQ
ncbi:zf-RVT domain-containing protein [Cucumis melo var. makuwa]|uniref:Zf-RVT domain-containing protein n=1 Tax=Cucumis melo var. makuwa TaxID=1194695 RepID=A0A5A7V088_CUCMM|nr:zf-RVT domain-containing protein [Cucumis melo var. makuwa]TYK21545.1 zf-RVT domain-containing protein [Cucumis melo var. makuwa]